MPTTSASSGMMLPAVPPWIAPIETTPNSVGSFSRLITLCTSTMKRAAIITGSIVVCGAEPWPPRPWNLIEQTVRRGGADTDAVADIAMGEGAVMQGEADIGLRKAREQAVGQHRLGAGDLFLGRLGDEHQRALPLVLQADQRLRRADPARHVDVVAAAMSDEVSRPFQICLVVAGIGQAGLFLHRQRVELGAHHDGRSSAVLVDRDQPGLADFLGDLEADRAHLGGELGGGLLLLEGDLGMGVDVLVERVELRVVALEGGLDRLISAWRRRVPHAPAMRAGSTMATEASSGLHEAASSRPSSSVSLRPEYRGASGRHRNGRTAPEHHAAAVRWQGGARARPAHFWSWDADRTAALSRSRPRPVRPARHRRGSRPRRDG